MDPRFGTLAWWLTDRRTGRRVISQRPNGPILAAMAGYGVATAAPTPELRRRAGAAGAAALAWWALLEIVSGANPFRRLMGVCGAGFAVASLVVVRSGPGRVDDR